MIYAQRKPDEIFTLIVENAVERALGLLEGVPGPVRTDSWPSLFPESSSRLDPDLGVSILKDLLRANSAQGVYRLKQYHWLVLYEALWNFCSAFNDGEAKFLRARLPAEGFQGLETIEFESLLDVFFWDLDFAISPEALQGLGDTGRQSMGVAEEVFGIAHRLRPHPNEVALSEVREPAWDADEAEEDLFPPGSSAYPSVGGEA